MSRGRVAERKCASNKVYYNKNDWKIKRAKKSVYKAKKTLLCVNRRGRCVPMVSADLWSCSFAGVQMCRDKIMSIRYTQAHTRGMPLHYKYTA